MSIPIRDAMKTTKNDTPSAIKPLIERSFTANPKHAAKHSSA